MGPRVRIAAVVAVLACVLGGCGGTDSSKGSDTAAPQAGPPIRIGTKNFTEQYVLGELYKQALEAKGFRVELKSDIGASEVIDQALVGGGIDMYPEYIGVLLSELARDHKRPTNAGAAYQVAKAFEERRGFALLETTPFTDSNALAVRPASMRSRGVRSIADLARIPGGAVIAAPPEFRTRFEGLVGLRSLYGLGSLRLRSLPIGKQYKALDDGDVDTAAVFTTDGQLLDRSYRLLRDPRGIFAAQHVAPVVSHQLIAAYGRRLTGPLNAVSRLLTTAAMRRMNAAVVLKGQTPAAVAARFLRGG